MSPSIQLSIAQAQDGMLEVRAFYEFCNRSTSINPDDTLVLARIDSVIIGVVRLCFESNTYVLRTMQIREDLQGLGIGRMILKRFQELLNERNIGEIFCMPYAHLEYFYGIIGFKKINNSEAPQFLQDRVSEFHQKHPKQSAILMKKCLK